MLTILISPSGSIRIEGDPAENQAALVKAFLWGPGHGLLFLDGASVEAGGESFAYWRDFARLYLSEFIGVPDLQTRDIKKKPVQIELPKDDLNRFLRTVPSMKGGEYVGKETLLSLWHEMADALHIEIVESGQSIEAFFTNRHSGWNLFGRVCFHLAENKKSDETPFAFLATYAHQISKDGKAQHLPLSRALEEYKDAKNKSVLLRLLSPLQKASKESEFIREQISSGDIYHTLAWTPKETYQFLKDIPIFEKSGIAVRVPNWWRARSGNRPQVAVRIGEKAPSGLGFDALLDFSMSVLLGEEELNTKEIQDLLSRSDNLVFFKGQWVEVNKEKLSDILSKWKTVAKSVKNDGLTFAEGMRMLSGVSTGTADIDNRLAETSTRILSGAWLTQALEQIRNPEIDSHMDKILSRNLNTRLRPYQRHGVQWLYQLNQMNLGTILADDMGLGKTIQIIALLLLLMEKRTDFKALLVVPASLIGNWKAELDRFGKSIRYHVAHPSGQGYTRPMSVDFHIVITTYGSVGRLEWLGDLRWDLLIADEAQAIKNPSAKQTRAIKSISSSHKIALTGTPVENRLSDLWSLFDFVSPGLLGSAKDFDSFLKRKTKSGESPYAPIRNLVRPYILRRLKTDKSVISDLPDKTELKSFCQLSKAQAALYQRSVETLAKEIKTADGIKRRGIILSYLMRFKQICNHPSQFLRGGDYSPEESGKFQRLRELCETIAEKQEKILVFTQFKEMTEPLNEFLTSIFEKPGLVLHGAILIKKRQEMVREFQEDAGPPFFVLSLKAGGTGLNLTAASHVIHFDRWWNPAVENQATDRAFRIGQKKNVLVHKFICKGTLEEKIDVMIESKQSMSKEILEGGGGALLTELGNEELLKIVALDINSAMLDG